MNALFSFYWFLSWSARGLLVSLWVRHCSVGEQLIVSCILCFKWGNSHGIKPLPLPVMLIVAGAALSVTKKIVEIAQK